MSRTILRSTSITGIATLLSRVTGLLREMVQAQAFGAGVLMDAFLVAYKIPNFLRRLFAEGAFSQSFVPVISQHKVKNTHAEVDRKSTRLNSSHCALSRMPSSA